MGHRIREQHGPGSPRWIALCREAAIAGQSLSAGLNALGKANYAATGLYSHAFFSLTVGFERTLKLIVCIDHALANGGRFPASKSFKTNYGHDIRKLFDHALVVHARLPAPERRYPIFGGEIEDKIIDFLSKFATTTRYYNLNFLGGDLILGAADPVADWFSSIGDLILEKHYTVERRNADLERARAMQAAFGRFALVRFTSEDGGALESLEAAAVQSSRNAVMQKHGPFYCVRIARFLFMVLYDLEDDARREGLEIPHLVEFFFPFMNDDSYLKSRKTFPPRGQ